MKNVEDIYPLSPVQEGMLFHTLKEPGSGVYVEQYCCRLSGNLHTENFRKAWEKVIERFGILRSVFIWEGLDEPLQVVRNEVVLSWDVRDWQQYSENDVEEQFSTFLKEDREEGFKLSKAPLMRFALFRLSETEYQFVWSFHHLISDGWSTPMILADMWKTYTALCRGKMPEFAEVKPYRDYIAWLQEQGLSEAETYWKTVLQGVSTAAPLQNFKTLQPEKGRGEVELSLPETLSEAMKKVARENRLTLNTLIQGAWALLLNRYSGEDDILYGATVSGRPAELAGVETIAGPFINTLPVRIQVATDEIAINWLHRIQQQQSELREYEYSPLVEVQKWSGITAGQNLFDSIVVFENYPLETTSDWQPDELDISDIRYIEQSNFPLAILAIPGATFRLIGIFNQSQFASETIKRILEHLQTALQAFVDNPNQPLKSISILSQSEWQQLAVLNATQADFPRESYIHQLIEEQAAKTPDNVAVVYNEKSITYNELNSRANQLANYLRTKNAGPNKLVGILLDRSLEMIVAILGVLKSGAAYIPIDPGYPEDRIEFMLKDSRASILLTNTSIVDQNSSIFNNQYSIINVNKDWPEIAKESPETVTSEVTAENLAYVIYTSGSTGNPKGVMITHRNLVHSTHTRFGYYQTPLQSFLLLSSFSFDSSVVGIFWTLCKGGMLCIPDSYLYKDAGHLGDLIQRHQISHLLCIPALYHVLLKNEKEKMQSLKTAIVAGEACSTEVVKLHKAVLPQTELFNEYGPTEGTVWASVFDCLNNFTGSSVPIGQPIENTQLYVLDKNLQHAPIGVPGELHIGGEGIARGYLNQGELTTGKFIENSFSNNGQQITDNKQRLYKTGDLARHLPDGNLEFLGRIDQQIKIRGYRIELGEIESALLEYPGVKEAAVVLGRGKSHLPIKETEISPEELAKQLLELDSAVATQILSEIEAPQNGSVTNPPALELAINNENEIVPESAAIHENESLPVESASQNGVLVKHRRHSDFEVTLNIKHEGFIQPPRKTQRDWLVNQVINEFSDDLLHLDKVAKKFVPGKDANLHTYDISDKKLADQQIMEDWQTPIMKTMAQHVCESHGDVLEIGFGRGISAGFIQEYGVKSHTIIESNSKVVEANFVPWMKQYSDKEIRLIFGKWQDIQEQLSTYDGIFFHAYPLNEQEFMEYVLNSITFAEHFFPVAAKLLRKGGVFSYLTTEIDSLSRRHQRALFNHFSSLTLSVEPLTIPEDTGDTWWTDSMVIVKAVK